MAQILLELYHAHKRAFHTTIWVLLIVFLALVAQLIFYFQTPAFAVHFLNVGQGDGELITLPGSVQVLIDGGKPNGLALQEIEKIMPTDDRTIEIVSMTHPQLDHFGGLIEVVKHYKVGAFVSNGRVAQMTAFQELERVLDERKIPRIVFRKGDRILYNKYVINNIWPEGAYVNTKDPNDGSLVFELVAPEGNMLFTGDIGSNIEDEIIKSYKKTVDVLKVPHHGSRFSSSVEFLNVIKPKVAIIEVGKNTYGHPTKEALSRLQTTGARIFRTDQGGTLEVLFNDGKIKIFRD